MNVIGLGTAQRDFVEQLAAQGDAIAQQASMELKRTNNARNPQNATEAGEAAVSQMLLKFNTRVVPVKITDFAASEIYLNPQVQVPITPPKSGGLPDDLLPVVNTPVSGPVETPVVKKELDVIIETLGKPVVTQVIDQKNTLGEKSAIPESEKQMPVAGAIPFLVDDSTITGQKTIENKEATKAIPYIFAAGFILYFFS